jgi:hypothetical protein
MVAKSVLLRGSPLVVYLHDEQVVIAPLVVHAKGGTGQLRSAAATFRVRK